MVVLDAVLILVFKVKPLQLLLELSTVHTSFLIAFSSLARRVGWVHSYSAVFLLIFHFDHCSLAASVDVTAHFFKREDLLAEVALSQGVRTLNGLVPNEFLFKNPFSTSFADNTGEVALAQLVSA